MEDEDLTMDFVDAGFRVPPIGHLHKSRGITLYSGSLSMPQHQQAKTELIFTMGVVGRVLHMLSSDVMTEMKTLFPNEDLEKNVQEAKTIFSHICASFQDKSKGYLRILEVRNCIRSLKRRAYEIEDILDKADPNHLEGKGIRARSKKAYKIRGILDKAATSHLEGKRIHERITDLKSGVWLIISDLEYICRVTMGKMSSKPSYIPPVLLSNASSHYERLLPSWDWEDQIIDRESEKQQLLDLICHPSNQHQHPNLILITGDSGVGKTTLVKLIFNDALVSASFDLLLWVSLKSTHYSTTTENLRIMIVEIIRSFTHQSWFYLQGVDMETLKYTLCDILAGQKYLLVLDDITYLRSGAWELLRELLKVGAMGSKVIFTATSSFGYWVHEMVSGANRLELKGLGEAGSWLLFSRCSKFDEEAEQEYYPSLSGIGRHIINKCCGNPGAIKTLGIMLRTNRDEHMWKQINESMFSFCLQSMSLQLVQCFSVYAIISKYTALSRDQLVYFWMAQGLLYSTEANDADLPDIGHRYCNELLSRSFIYSYQSDDHNRLFVNDAFQQLLTSIKDEEIQHFGYPSRFAGSGRHLICYMDTDFFRRNLNAEANTRIFLFGRWPNAVGKGSLELLISQLSRARVLLLDGLMFDELPKTIGNLKLLRYLSLQGNHQVQLLPETICKLANLQTLDLSGCQQLTTLPKSMHTLTSLRHLFLSLKLTSIPGEVLKSWSSLHHLKICHSPNLKSIPEEILNLTDLRILQIHHCPFIASLPNNIKFLKSLKELSIINCEMLNLDKWDGLFGLKVLEFLQLQRLPMLINFPEGLLSAAHSLQHLILRYCQYLTALPECLHRYKSLLEIAIEDCPNITTLPNEIKAIESLQILKIVNCPHLIARCQTIKGEDWHLISHIPKIHLQTIPNRRATSTLKKHPGALPGEDRFDEPEVPVKDVECPTATPSSQDELSYSTEERDEDSSMEKKKDYCSILSLLPDYYEIEKDTLDQLWMAGNEEQVKDELLKQDGEANFKFVLENGFILRSETNFMTGKDRYLIDSNKITEFLNDQNDNGSFYLKLDDGYLNNSKPADSIHHVSVVCNEVDGTVFETLQQFNNLRTLLFLGKHRHKIRQLPDQLFLSFANLRALDLNRTQITELPSSTLKLRGCSNFRELPAEFRRLTNLRHLDLDVLRQLETMPKELGALVNLQTLSAFLVGTEEGFKIRELKNLNKLAGKFCIAMLENVESADEANEAALREKDQIKTLELRWTESQLSGEHFDSFEILESLEPSKTLEELRILCYEGSEIPRWISDPGFDKLACITFYKCKNLSKLPPIEHLPLLKYLRLVKMTNIEKIEFEGEQRSSGAFSSLEKVEIDEMQSLIVWDWERRNDDDLKSLTQLTVNDCPELHRFNVVRHLVSIKHLEIRECPKLESLSDTEVPRSLEELIVEDCPHLQKKYSEHEGGDWFKVKHVPNINIR